MTSFELTLPIAAHTKQRPRFGRGRAYTPAETRGWEELLAWRFIEQHGRPRLTCPVRVELYFGGVQPNQDIDNLAKSCLDALNGIAFEDDRQVVELVARKASDRTPQTVIAGARRAPLPGLRRRRCEVQGRPRRAAGEWRLQRSHQPAHALRSVPSIQA